jgi:hypothetical protein
LELRKKDVDNITFGAYSSIHRSGTNRKGATPMDIKTLTIYVDGDEMADMVAAHVTKDQSPALFEAFKAWQDAEQASHDEADKWDRVLEVAAEYLSDAGDYLHADGDIEVSDVTFFGEGS